MEVGQKIRRIKHNLQAKKADDEELKKVEPLINRNGKVSQFVATFRKDLASTLTTGFREENVDKRKKKVEELSMAANLKEMSVDLDYLNTSCLHHVINGLGTVLHNEVDEKVKLEMALERRVHEELGQFCEYEKHITKSKDKLSSLSTDLEIACKNWDKENSPSHKDEYDAIQMKYDGLKDAVLTEVFTSSVPKEFMVAEIIVTGMNLKRDYFKKMLAIYDAAIPTVESMIANAVPRPVFGVPLEQHLATSKEEIAVVLTKTCEFLRRHAMKEKGLFRINGNMAKVKRICAALDAGMFDVDEKNYLLDPHSVASVLKAYLRELPDPVTQDSMRDHWIEALNKTGDELFSALEDCIQKMSRGHRDNLFYLMRFLYDFEANRVETQMNAANLAIVFAPTVTGMVYDGMNSCGVKLIEIFISHAARIFKFPPQKAPTPITEASVDISPPSTFTRAQLSISPRSFRPKEKAPPPPVDGPGTSGNLIELNTDDDDFSDDYEPPSSNGNFLARSSTERRPNRPPPPAFRASTTDTPKSRPISYNIAVGARPSESAPPKPMAVSLEDVLSDVPVAPERKRLSVMSMGGLSRVGPNANQTNQQSSSQESSTGSLVTDGGDNRTLVSLDGELSSSHSSVLATTSAPSSVPVNVQPPPQSAKPKPPLPFKPKDLSNESSRL